MIKVEAGREFYSEGVKLLLLRYETREDGTRRRQFLRSDNWTEFPAAPFLPAEAFIELGHDEAQELMDSLWACGIRPTEGAGSAGAMSAVQEHLKDLRKVLDKFLARD
jgi:hypothetical protein